MTAKYTKEDVLKFLKSQYIMEVATCNDNKPSASVLLYTVDDDFNIYFATHKNTFKSKNLQENPQISGNIWEHRKMLVQFDGNTELIEDQESIKKILDKLAESATRDDNFWPPIFKIKGDGYAFFKIKPYWLRALDLEENTVRQEESPFTEIIKK